jgi:hypothetical protein
LSIQQRFYLNFAITSVVVLWKCLKPALIFVLLSTLLIATHAFLRDPKHIEASMDAAADGGPSALSPSGSTVMLLRDNNNNSSSNNNNHKTDHSSDDDYYDDEEANMGSSAGSSGSEKGAVLVDLPTSSGSGTGTGMTKRRGDVI